MITMSLQTKLGEKVSILVDRVTELWNGKSDNKKNQKKIVEIAGVGSIVNHPLMKKIEWYHIHPINKSGIGTITFKIKKNK